jgi:hypothetical protein
VPTARICVVSFTDSEGIRHSVEVTASTLYEAAALAINEFRRCGFTSNAPGPATRLTFGHFGTFHAFANLGHDCYTVHFAQ